MSGISESSISFDVLPEFSELTPDIANGANQVDFVGLPVSGVDSRTFTAKRDTRFSRVELTGTMTIDGDADLGEFEFLTVPTESATLYLMRADAVAADDAQADRLRAYALSLETRLANARHALDLINDGSSVLTSAQHREIIVGTRGVYLESGDLA